MSASITYQFIEIAKCNMCFAPRENFKVMGKRMNLSQGLFPSKKRGLSVSVCKCKNCGLIFSDPMPVPLDISDHYGIPPESYWSESYFQLNPNYFGEEINTLKKLIDISDNPKSLDIGAGIGKQMIALKSAGFDTYGFEPSKPFFDKAIEKFGFDQSKFSLGSIETMNYESEKFDFISFGAVLEHLTNPSQSIEKALNWTRTGGIIHIEVPSADWLIAKLHNLAYKIRGLDYVTNISPMHIPYHLYEFSLDSFRKNSKILGYEIALSQYYVCETYLPKVLDYVLNPIMKHTNSGMQLCVWLRKI